MPESQVSSVLHLSKHPSSPERDEKQMAIQRLDLRGMSSFVETAWRRHADVCDDANEEAVASRTPLQIFVSMSTATAPRRAGSANFRRACAAAAGASLTKAPCQEVR